MCIKATCVLPAVNVSRAVHAIHVAFRPDLHHDKRTVHFLETGPSAVVRANALSEINIVVGVNSPAAPEPTTVVFQASSNVDKRQLWVTVGWDCLWFGQAVNVVVFVHSSHELVSASIDLFQHPWKVIGRCLVSVWFVSANLWSTCLSRKFVLGSGRPNVWCLRWNLLFALLWISLILNFGFLKTVVELESFDLSLLQFHPPPPPSKPLMQPHMLSILQKKQSWCDPM